MKYIILALSLVACDKDDGPHEFVLRDVKPADDICTDLPDPAVTGKPVPQEILDYCKSLEQK